jgi:segregation and condensation protein B
MTDPATPYAAEQRSIPEFAEDELPRAIVAMLFAAREPATVSTLARVTGYETRRIRRVLADLTPKLEHLGLMLQWPGDDSVQLATQPEHSALVRRFLGIERTSRLSAAALEVVAIIAYRQPVTRPEIDAVRGVDSSGVIQTLLAHELIEPVGRLPGPGNPIQFGTTGEFLRLFGLASLDELPELPENLVEALSEGEAEEDEPDSSG